jgi:molybdopterin adenylyltransferase
MKTYINKISAAILTISDRSSQGIRQDRSGPALTQVLIEQGWSIKLTLIVPDDLQIIKSTLLSWCEDYSPDLILTTGGTGFAQRDITPEATLSVIQRSAPGLSEVMRQQSLNITPHAMLSRGISGIRQTTLIVNLPGSPRAAVENLNFILPVLPHAADLLKGSPTAESGHHPSSTHNTPMPPHII